MVTIHKINSYEIKKDDRFFFDTNIWMYMYCSIGNYGSRLVEDYSSFYQKVKQAGNPIITNTLLISEFVNAYSRLEYNLIKDRDGITDYKKDFRSNPNYKHLFDNINLLTERKVIGNSMKLQDKFDEFEEKTFFTNPNTYDFNDEYYCYTAEKSNFIIVTHDKDFQNTHYDIQVLTR